MLIADISQVDADAGFAVKQFAQFRDREAVACMNADDGWSLMQERLDFRGKLLRQVFQLGTKPRLHALAGPDQLFAECGELGSLAAAGFDQRGARRNWIL